MKKMLGLIYVNDDKSYYLIYTPNNKIIQIYGDGSSLELAKLNFEKNLAEIIDGYNGETQLIPSEILNVEIRYSTRNDFPIGEKILILLLGTITGYILCLLLREFYLPIFDINMLALFLGSITGCAIMIPLEKFYWKIY